LFLFAAFITFDFKLFIGMQTSVDKSQKNQAPTDKMSRYQSGGEATFQFVDNRIEAVNQRQLQESADTHASQQPIQRFGNETPIMFKKDAALWKANDKEAGHTSTKIVMTKSGTKGIFRFPMNGDIIDTFIGKNEADESLKPVEHADAVKMDIPVGVADHDLSQKYGEVEGLSDGQVTGGSRPVHFKHADDSHKVARDNTYTWHHKSSKGKMELIDMNVHGAMWHYGGIAGWKASVHDGGDTDDDPSVD
jgi:hypothetical protein